VEEIQRKDDLEEYGVVLDYLPTGRSSSVRSEPLAQLLGESKFTLLEVVPKSTEINIEERLYIGKGEREKVALIRGRILYENLTEGSKNELPNAIASIINRNEQRFVNFFNNASPLNIRMHSLELLPGIGKKHLAAILEARDEKPFDSFKDLTERVPLLQAPIKLITDRVLLELKGDSRFYILARPPHRAY
jgi:putative nucleotide binding protein